MRLAESASGAVTAVTARRGLRSGTEEDHGDAVQAQGLTEAGVTDGTQGRGLYELNHSSQIFSVTLFLPRKWDVMKSLLAK